LFDRVIVHPRVNAKRPEITEDDVATAWKNAFVIQRRNSDSTECYAAAGIDSKSRILEMIGVEREDGTIIVIHAMKLTNKMRAELGL